MSKIESGTPFGKYTIEGFIAGGGMGEVYAARHDVYGTVVALKVLHEDLHADPSWRVRFNEEAVVGQLLKHPHVVAARELVEHGGRVGLVMDLVSGGRTLEKVMTRGFPEGLALVPALKLFLGIVQGVEYAHDKEIVHGDLKPENVLVEGDIRDAATWTPRVTDFGTVGLVAHPVILEGRPAVVATPRYASPEHLLGVTHIERRSDIYALGLVLHFILTGRHASPARDVNQAATWVREPRPMLALVDQPEAVQELYRKATARNPDERYPDCRELAVAVRAILDSLGERLDLDDLQSELATELVESGNDEGEGTGVEIDLDDSDSEIASIPGLEERDAMDPPTPVAITRTAPPPSTIGADEGALGRIVADELADIEDAPMPTAEAPLPAAEEPAAEEPMSPIDPPPPSPIEEVPSGVFALAGGVLEAVDDEAFEAPAAPEEEAEDGEGWFGDEAPAAEAPPATPAPLGKPPSDNPPVAPSQGSGMLVAVVVIGVVVAVALFLALQ